MNQAIHLKLTSSALFIISVCILYVLRDAAEVFSSVCDKTKGSHGPILFFMDGNGRPVGQNGNLITKLQTV